MYRLIQMKGCELSPMVGLRKAMSDRFRVHGGGKDMQLLHAMINRIDITTQISHL